MEANGVLTFQQSFLGELNIQPIHDKTLKSLERAVGTAFEEVARLSVCDVAQDEINR